MAKRRSAQLAPNGAPIKCLFGAFVAWLAAASPAAALVDSCPTLGQVIKNSEFITVLEVDKVSHEKRAIIFKKLADLKGKNPVEKVGHQITDGQHPREPKLILSWAEPGQQAIVFQSKTNVLTCIGPYWYDCTLNVAPWWTMNYGRPEMPLAYTGKVSRLRQHVVDILAGKEVVVMAIDDTQQADFKKRDSVYTKLLLRGKEFPVRRIKAGLKWDSIVQRSPEVGKGAGGAADVPPLLAALKGQEAAERADAAEELGLIGPAARSAVAALTEALRDAEGRVQIAAAGALARIDPKNEKAQPVLTAALKAKAAKVRREAALTLGELALNARIAVPALIDALPDDDPNIRWAVIEALGRFHGQARPAIPAVASLLKDKDADVRGAAADALAWIGHRSANPALIEALKDSLPSVRWAAAIALARIGGPGAEAGAPILVLQMEKSINWHNSYPIYRHLRSLGPGAKNVLPIVEKHFKKDGRIDGLLAAMGSKTVVPHYLKNLKSTANHVRYYAVLNLGLIGAEAEEAVPALTEMLKDPKLGFQAGWALNMIRLKGKERIPVLVQVLNDKVLRDKDEVIRSMSAEILGWMGPDAREAVPALEGVLKDKDEWRPNVRAAVEEALRKIQD